MHVLKKLLPALAVIAVAAPVAFASGPSLKLSHGSTWANAEGPGHTVRVYGSVGNGCQVGKPGDVATIYSKGFVTKHTFAGIPSVNAPLTSKGNFSVKVSVSQNTGAYAVSGRCGGGKFASAKLHILVGGY
jgi:hypothetical protein